MINLKHIRTVVITDLIIRHTTANNEQPTNSNLEWRYFTSKLVLLFDESIIDQFYNLKEAHWNE